MRFHPLLSLLLLMLMRVAGGAAVAPEVVELSFSTRFARPGALEETKVPAWITKVEQRDGRFTDGPNCWQVMAAVPEGQGRLEITLDRKQIGGSLVATVLFDAGEDADVAVQLFDAHGRVVVVDLYGNLVDVGAAAKTDTFILPLGKYPTAEKVVIRRISGALKVYGVVLYPVVNEGTPVKEELEKLARVLGDPLSPDNPLVKGLQQIAKRGDVAIHAPPVVTSTKTQPGTPAPREKYAAAIPPAAGVKIMPPPSEGLVAHWSFNQGDAADASGRGHHGKMQAGARIGDGARGRVAQFHKNPSTDRSIPWDAVIVPASPALDLKDTMTLAAWIKFSSIAPTWGSQIIWHGDSEFGRDPWVLHVLPSGTLEFRSDRSVTGRPEFTVFENELYLAPSGKPMMNQHVGVESPQKLEREKWYFVAGTMEKTSARIRTLRLFVNGVAVSEVKTPETVNYETAQMWTTIGAVDKGTWQNFDGEIDDVRIYNRALSPAEIAVLYQQPWK